MSPMPPPFIIVAVFKDVEVLTEGQIIGKINIRVVTFYQSEKGFFAMVTSPK
jgi:hypothetical protein